jgi:hypothetical protein
VVDFKYFPVDATPVIVVGMHRSGTGLLARILGQLGVFMGCELTGNQESVFFQTLNKDALDIIGCSWRCVDFLPKVDEMYSHYAWLLAFVRRRLDSGVMIGHFGIRETNNSSPIDSTWGWKDPRNSLLLPIWHQIFPKAKVIHMLRDGRHAALSLLARDIKREKLKDFFRTIQEQRFKSYFELWEIYIRRIGQTMNRFDSCYTVRYENLLDSPQPEIRKLADFLNQPIQKPIEEVCTLVDRRKTGRQLEPEFRWVERVQVDLRLLNELGYP